MPFDIDPRVDFAFQRLFGTESNKPLLIDLLNAVLSPAPGEEVVDVRLRNPLNPQAFGGDECSVKP